MLSENEGSFLRDIDGDGIPEWITNSWNKENPTLSWKLRQGSEPQLQKCIIGENANGHGMAFGDINNDGREDILVGTGWYERPAGKLFAQPWEFHPDWDLHASVPMLVFDLNRDGKNDLIWGKGHDFGVYWWEAQEPEAHGGLVWKEHVIDESYSQPHALALADLDGDGENELITGKRVRAHNGKDPGGDEPPCIYYYKWNSDTLVFTRYTINEGQVGIGLQIRTADLNGDGRLDIAVAGKSGTYILFNEGAPQ
jgi:hypothetical protein